MYIGSFNLVKKNVHKCIRLRDLDHVAVKSSDNKTILPTLEHIHRLMDHI